ncbi:isochorismatase family cysteine hydrolase [Priestia megaterium]|uniref:cysteine hydrolase family protein n=1 Tax=Priestia megaterium TaxID=1404 RepID=UPI000BF98B62|nr:isochorismatase family cysteine hydrolase [Priestia megaterium]MEB2292524.1 cysteine hydrolase [Priestia megaterium]PEZ14286.1 isochorismatase [Priestia megaterium]PGK32004.1 isochorismatase [Priestia megaterium]
MKKALINIDYTNDFVAENGALTCGEPGRHIETFICDITHQFIEQNEYVVFAIDFHKENDSLHPESALFPPHNVEGSAGRELYGKLNDLYNVYQSQVNVEWMNKTRYSAFAGTDLEIKLRERQITDVYLAGVCTDICVLHTAVDAYNKGFAIYIYEKAVASFNQKGHEWALEHFKSCLGAEII